MAVATGSDPTRVIDLSVPGDRESLVADWLRLAADVPETSYFQSPDWALSWMNNFGAGRPTRRAALRRERGPQRAEPTIDAACEAR